ncbi:MAG TPA: hypothetical protein VGH72_33740 [Pseudonocardia sp.]|jgi:hypothetical protein
MTFTSVNLASLISLGLSLVALGVSILSWTSVLRSERRNRS